MSTATNVPFTAPNEGQFPVQTPSLADQDVLGQAAEAQAPLEDPLEVANLEIYASRGWTRVNKNGKSVPDDALAKNAVYELFRDNVLINNESAIVDDGLGQADLYAKIFPATQSDPMDEVLFEAYQQVKRKLWQWAGPSVKGSLSGDLRNGRSRLCDGREEGLPHVAR